MCTFLFVFFFFFQAEDGIRDYKVTGVQTCALPISSWPSPRNRFERPEERFRLFQPDEVSGVRNHRQPRVGKGSPPLARAIQGIPVVISVDDEHGPGITGRHGTPVPIAERGHDRIYVLGHIAGAVRSPIRRVSERSGRTPRYPRSSRAVRWRATPWMLPRDPRAADFMKSPIRRHVQAGLERRGSLLRIRYAPRRD